MLFFYAIISLGDAMNKEIEIRLLDVDKEDFIKQILSLGASKDSEFLQRRYTYDFNPVVKNKWIRLRTNGKKTTLTIKEIIDKKSISGTNELEIEVSDFNKTNLVLEKLGYNHRNYQENYREIYYLDDVEISIDSWPLIPTYVEFESKSEEKINSLLEKLSYKKENLTTLDVTSIYNDIYDIDILKIKELQFEKSDKK